MKYVFFLSLLINGSLSAQNSNVYEGISMADNGLSAALYTTRPIRPEIDAYYSFYSYASRNYFQSNRTVHQMKPPILNTQKTSSGKDNPKTTFWEELGYVIAMESVFLGMSYLASRQSGYGPKIAGSFDFVMGIAGILNASSQDLAVQKIGHYLIASGFLLKSLYNFQWNTNHTIKFRFGLNFISYNVLVFSGYYLDTL